MKKSILTTLCFICIVSQAQIAYYDAKLLYSLDFDNKNFVKDYTDANKDFKEATVNIEEIRKFRMDPFDNDLQIIDMKAFRLGLIRYKEYVESGQGVTNFLGTGTIFSVASGLLSNEGLSSEQQTKIIDGFVKYTAEEYKKAQTQIYLNAMEETIGSSGELLLFFPKTYTKFKNTPPHKLTSLENELRPIFNQDLRSLLERLESRLSDPTNYSVANLSHEFGGNPKYSSLTDEKIALIRTNCPLYPYLDLGIFIGSKLSNNYHPVDLFYALNEKYCSGCPSKFKTGTTNAIHLIHIIQKNLVDTTTNKNKQFSNAWINLKDFVNLNAIEQKYFAGLIYNQNKAFFTRLPISGNELKEIVALSSDVLAQLVEIQNIRTNLKEDNLNDNYLEYMKKILRTINIGNSLFNRHHSSLSVMSDNDFNEYLRYTENVITVYDLVRRKEYGNLSYYLDNILKGLLNGNTNFSAKLGLIDTIDQYTSFMADVINAKSSEEVKSLIREHVAPPLSFIVKREFTSSMSVSAHPGMYGGKEQLEIVNSKDRFTYGLTLPLGVELNFATNLGFIRSIGFYGQLLDLGAVLSYRMREDSTTDLPENISLKQVYAPGLSINLGLNKIPWAIGIGLQKTSSLRSVTKNGNVFESDGLRYFIRFSFDLPIVNIFKSYKKLSK